jgi:hypothetical protein
MPFYPEQSHTGSRLPSMKTQVMRVPLALKDKKTRRAIQKPQEL